MKRFQSSSGKIFSKREIEALIHKFQEGEREIGLAIQEAFSPYLNKYHSLLETGVFSWRNREIRQFLLLFIADPKVRRKVKARHTSKYARERLWETAQWMKGRCEGIDSESELSLAFYELLNRYRPKGRAWFAGYLMGSFRFQLKNQLANLWKDPLSHEYEEYTDVFFAEGDLWSCEEPWVHSDSLYLHDLNELERLFLYLKLVEGEGMQEISDRYGFERTSVWYKIKEGERKLREKLL